MDCRLGEGWRTPGATVVQPPGAGDIPSADAAAGIPSADGAGGTPSADIVADTAHQPSVALAEVRQLAAAARRCWAALA